MKQVVVAFSGGLDTSWCVALLKNQGYEVTTVTVDVGGFSADELAGLEAKSKSLGAIRHIRIDAKQIFFDTVLRWLIAGNVLRGGLYPLCVGAERTLQAQLSAEKASELGIGSIAHGCTAAGNDQVRFEVALRCLAPGVEIIAPVRDLAPSREQQMNDLGLPLTEKGKYSVNTGLWGVTIGGAETTGTAESIPEEQWIRTKGAFEKNLPPRTLTIGFLQGQPVSLDGAAMNPVALIETLDKIAGEYGIGRGIHLGETILGIKGRVAFEAPAASVLIQAHRELEKLVLTKKQSATKDLVAATYGDLVHEGQFLDPTCRDIEALLANSQQRVTGTVSLLLRPGSSFVTGVESTFSLHAASRAVYGEAVGEWTPEDAKGFSRIYGLPAILAARAGVKK